MATLLDSFFTRLGFEVDEGALQSAQSKIAGLGKSLLGLGIFSGLSVAGIYKLTSATASALGAVQQVSERTGIAATSIAAMSKAAASFDVPAENTRASLENLNRTLGGIVTGTAPRMVKVFQTLGLSAKDAAGQQKTAVDFLGDVAQKVQGMSTGAQQQILSRLGIDQNMIGMLRNGREEFMNLYETAAKGIPFKSGDYEKAALLEKGFREVRAAVTMVGQSIALELMPPMQMFIDKFKAWWNSEGKVILDDFRKKIRFWSGEIAKLVNAFRVLTGGMSPFTAVLKVVGFLMGALLAYKLGSWAVSGAKAVGGLAKALWTMAGASIAGLAQFLLIAVAIAALGFLIYAVIEDFVRWRAGASSVIGIFEERYPKAFAVVKGAITSLRDAFVLLWTRIKELWETNKPLFILLAKILGTVILAAIVLVIGAFILLLNITTRVLAFIIGLVTKLTKYLSEMLPIEQLERYWQQFKDSFIKSIGELKAGWDSATKQIKEIWQATTDTLSAAWNWLKNLWKTELDKFLAGWQFLSDGIRAIWSALMGWLEPFFQRIEKVFNFISDKAGAIGGKVKDWLPSPSPAKPTSVRAELAGLGWSPLAPAPAFAGGGSAPLAPAPAMAGAEGIAPAMPAASAVTNANKTSTVNNNTDMKVTMNINGAASPAATADAVSDRLRNAQVNTRIAQGAHF